jgi:RNA polymerase sigma-70 factor (family 1)
MKVLSFAAPAGARPYAAWDDAALVIALEASNKQAFSEIYARYWQPLYALALRKLGTAPDAEEVVQDLFVALWQKRATARIHTLEGYLATAAKYKIIDCLRARMAQAGYVAFATPRLVSADPTTEEILSAADLSEALAASVASLPAHTQAVFRLSREQYQSVPEIAAQLNLAPKTVEYHLTRSLRFLRTRLKDFLMLGLWFSHLLF